MAAYGQQQQRDLTQKHHEAQIAQSQAQLAHQNAVLAETARHHKELTSDARRRTDMMDDRVRRRYGLDERSGLDQTSGESDANNLGLDDEGRIYRMPVSSGAPNIGPRDENYPPRTAQAAPDPRRPAIGYGAMSTSDPSANVRDMRGLTPPGNGQFDSKDDAFIRRQGGVYDNKAMDIMARHPDKERLNKYLETQRLWRAVRGAPPSGYDFRDDGSLNNLKEGTSIKEMKLDKEIPIWLQHLEVSRKVLGDAGNLERGVAEAWNAIPGVRQFNPLTSTIEARDIAAHAVQQLVNYTRAANHANKVDERHLEWFVPKASDPADLAQFKLSQASNIFTTYLSARAKGAKSDELSNLIRQSLDASEKTNVFQRYKRLTGSSGNAPMTSSNIEDITGAGSPPSSTQNKVDGGAPRAGTIMQGYRFRGGDPSNRNNWERVR
jgi:hypothetical protein